ncbi:hypothetical protein [Desulfovulcanus sp.]
MDDKSLVLVCGRDNNRFLARNYLENKSILNWIIQDFFPERF